MNNEPTNNMRSALLRYLQGDLTDDERFELENGPLQTAGVRDTLEALAKEKNMAPSIEEDFNDISDRWQQRITQLSKQPSSRWQLWAAAAASLLLAVFAYGYYEQQSGSRLYADYFDAGEPQEYLAVRGEAIENQELAAALQAYNEADYPSSSLQFKALRENHPFDSQVLLYTGLSAMQLGDYHTARQAFNQLLSLDVAEADRASARWYLALVYLRQDQPTAAKTELLWLSKNNTGAIGAKAKALLEEI